MEILDILISSLSSYATSKGKSLRRKDANNTGKDDLGGQALITLAALGEAYVDDELAMNDALADKLEDLAEMLRSPVNLKTQ